MQIQPPVRVAHTYTHHYNAPPERVFPLLCPVREVDWVDGWLPEVVYTASGVAEPHCTWTMPDGAIWTVLEHDPQAGRVAFLKTTPGLTVARIEIQVRPDGENASTADVTYQHTALTRAGADFVETFTEDHYRGFMQGWERALNHYLETGEKLT